MVKYSAKSLDATFGALADSTRRAILERLAQGEARVTELAAPFAISLPAVSKHLRVLRVAGLLVREKNGRIQQCRLDAGPMKDATEWLAHYQRHWEKQSAPSPAFGHKANQDDVPQRRATAKHSPFPFPSTKSSWPILFNLSVNFDENTLDATFFALADSTRRAMLVCMAFTESSVTELAAPFNISLPALSKHLRILQRAGLVERRKEGRFNLCRLVATPMQDAALWTSRYRMFWEKQLDSLAAYLEKSNAVRA
ncbi:MAG: ArsR/SmtB family transcription factor [bacterium]